MSGADPRGHRRGTGREVRRAAGHYRCDEWGTTAGNWGSLCQGAPEQGVHTPWLLRAFLQLPPPQLPSTSNLLLTWPRGSLGSRGGPGAGAGSGVPVTVAGRVARSRPQPLPRLPERPARPADSWLPTTSKLEVRRLPSEKSPKCWASCARHGDQGSGASVLTCLGEPVAPMMLRNWLNQQGLCSANSMNP